MKKFKFYLRKSFVILILWIPIFTNIYGQQIMEKSNNSSGINFFCSNIEIHPINEDFEEGQEGKVLISTEHDDTYYTPYQIKDAEVSIELHLPEDRVGTIIYFRVVVPDKDDVSSYESDATNDDNRDPDIEEGVLSHNTAVANLEDINGEMKAIAKVTLHFTDRYAGDNYKVEASLSENFSTVYETTTMTAWKRIYVEVDKMYKKGALLRTSYISDANNNDDEILVDNVGDFEEGMEIEIFAPPSSNQATIQTRIESIDDIENMLRIEDTEGTYDFPSISGIKIVNENQTLDISTQLVLDAFGQLTHGEDGGTFVEFNWDFDDSGIIPKVTVFPNSLIAVRTVATFWGSPNCDVGFDNKCYNYIHLVIANDFEQDGLRATSDISSDLVVIFEDNIINDANVSASQIELAKSEVLVHEFGHHFELLVGTLPVVHSSSTTEYPNHESTDQGVMSYGRNLNDGIAEFYLDCIYFIRDLIDKI